MIISEITISNFKNYFNEKPINLNVSDMKNIIVIGGFNGAGKTTITEAIRLCLYGRMMNGTPMSESKYCEYLESVINRETDKKQFFIKLSVELTETIPHRKYEITRTFKRKVSHLNKDTVTFEEMLDLRQGDQAVELINDTYWDYFVGKLIPPATSRYFFFDGENIRNIIASDGASEYLSSAIKDLSGITDLITLKTDLEGVRKKILSKSTSKTSSAKIAELQGIKESLVSRNEEFKDKKKVLENTKSLKQDELSKVEKIFKQKTGQNAEKYVKLKSQYDSLDKQKRELESTTNEFMQFKLPFVISRDILKKTVVRAKSEEDSAARSCIRSYLQGLQESDFIDRAKKDNIDVSAAIDFMLDDLKYNEKRDIRSILDLTNKQIYRMDSINISGDEIHNFINSVEERESIKYEMEKLEKQLSITEDESTIEIRKKIEVINEEINRINKDILNIEAIVSFNNDTIVEKEKLIREEEKKTLLNELDKEMISNIDKITNEVDLRIDKIKVKSVEKLESETNEMYNSLKNKKSMVKKISFSKNMDVLLHGYSIDLINVKNISEGEKGILMYSIIYGLHKMSGSNLPMIIDSPLGKMDSLHMNNLINNYYPIASDQVIILSHDREITKDIMLKMNDKVSHTYFISSEEKENKVKDGYFE